MSAVESVVQTIVLGGATVLVVAIVLGVLVEVVEVFGVRFLAWAAVLLPVVAAVLYGVGALVRWIVS